MFRVVREDKEPHIVVLSTRQGGKTEGLALLIIWICLLWPLISGIPAIVEYYAPTEKLAKDVGFERVRNLIRFGKHTLPDGRVISLRDELLPGKAGIKEKGEMRWKNGSIFRIQTASEGAQVRGVSPTHSFVDESGSINDRMYWADIRGAGKALKGITYDMYQKVKHLTIREQQEYFGSDESGAIKTRYLEAGTPIGNNHFKKVSDPGSGAYVIRQPYWLCPFSNVADIEADRLSMPLREWEAEYCTVFNTDINNAFPLEQILRTCVLDHKRVNVPQEGRYYYAGVDLGQIQDHTVMYIGEWINGMLVERFRYKWDLNEEWDKMKAEMNDIYQRWQPRFMLMDRTGRWRRIYLECMEEFNWNMRGWLYTTDTKCALMFNVQILMQNEQIELSDDDRLQKELSDITEKRTSGMEKPLYPKPDEGDDTVQALALMAMACKLDTDPGIDIGVTTLALVDKDLHSRSTTNVRRFAPADTPFAVHNPGSNIIRTARPNAVSLPLPASRAQRSGLFKN